MKQTVSRLGFVAAVQRRAHLPSTGERRQKRREVHDARHRGCIAARANHAASELVVTVSDRGPGVPVDKLTSIFE